VGDPIVDEREDASLSFRCGARVWHPVLDQPAHSYSFILFPLPFGFLLSPPPPSCSLLLLLSTVLSSDPFADDESPAEFSKDESGLCAVPQIQTFFGSYVNNIGGYSVYRTGPFSRLYPGSLKFSDFSCAYDSTDKALKSLEFMALFTGTTTPQTCFGFQSTFRGAQNVTKCPHNGQQGKGGTKTVQGPITSVTGCINYDSISLMKVNGLEGQQADCGISNEGFAFDAYPQGLTKNSCTLGWISGYAIDGGVLGILSRLYFYWKC